VSDAGLDDDTTPEDAFDLLRIVLDGWPVSFWKALAALIERHVRDLEGR